MVRIAGVDLPAVKPTFVALTYIYGIGRSSALKICQQAGVDIYRKLKDLHEEEINRIRHIIETQYKVEGELRKEVQAHIRRLIDIGCYRGIRHVKGLPVRGQRTRTNARTRKGPRGRQIAIKKKKVRK
ncbi:MAG: 30S ribosomal protein S13 [Acidobacteria bacterium]|nr:30S ribosomal protein S13 [Acidobacteriota bacterium]MDW7985549.1 30S ribosomal protein S13 [Acidobacteriota bacterium]